MAKYLVSPRPVFCYNCGRWHISGVRVPRCGICHRRTVISLPEIPKKLAEMTDFVRKLEATLDKIPPFPKP